MTWQWLVTPWESLTKEKSGKRQTHLWGSLGCISQHQLWSRLCHSKPLCITEVPHRQDPAFGTGPSINDKKRNNLDDITTYHYLFQFLSESSKCKLSIWLITVGKKLKEALNLCDQAARGGQVASHRRRRMRALTTNRWSYIHGSTFFPVCNLATWFWQHPIDWFPI